MGFKSNICFIFLKVHLSFELKVKQFYKNHLKELLKLELIKSFFLSIKVENICIIITIIYIYSKLLSLSLTPSIYS